MRQRENLKDLLNLHILDNTNLTPKYGKFDMPYMFCPVIPSIDYIATYSQPKTYFNGENTCVSFNEYDKKFDGEKGLWNAIYYDNRQLQQKYIERFKGVRYFIAPDYSKCGDIPEIENHYRQFRARIVSIWLTMNIGAVVIPLVSCANEYGMQYMLEGMENCNVVAFNAKGPMGDPIQLEIFKRAIQYTVDHLLKLKTIIVYSSSCDIPKVLEIFHYAIQSGIDVQIPDNMLQTRHRIQGVAVMAATHDSGLGHGSKGHPQTSLEENTYAQQVNKNASNKPPSPIYHPSPKHDPSHNWGSENPIKTSKEGQHLLDTGYKQGRQIYNITANGTIVKFQPDNSPDNGYHAYKVSSPRDIPASILKKLRDEGKISPSDYNKYRKGKK